MYNESGGGSWQWYDGDGVPDVLVSPPAAQAVLLTHGSHQDVASTGEGESVDKPSLGRVKGVRSVGLTVKGVGEQACM